MASTATPTEDQRPHSATPEQAEAMREITRIVMESPDPGAAAGRALELFAAVRAEERQLAGHVVQDCGVFTWCTETGDHEWHQGEAVQISQDCDLVDSRKHDHTTDPYIDAKMTAEDDRDTGVRGAGACVAFGECELTADGMRAEVAKILAATPRLLAMADSLDGKPAYVPPTDWGDAERIVPQGEKGALINASLFTPTEHGMENGPTVLAVFSEPSREAELDLDGARDLREQLLGFLPKLDVMIGALAELAAQ